MSSSPDGRDEDRDGEYLELANVSDESVDPGGTAVVLVPGDVPADRGRLGTPGWANDPC